ncbi:hypothetical protein HMPREF1870_02377 [Bacteroidales bacterium KA00344]|nr:hypothetical protein HMPREF1870_02377 [Bacteroidales bacterium KA00344]
MICNRRRQNSEGESIFSKLLIVKQIQNTAIFAYFGSKDFYF